MTGVEDKYNSQGSKFFYAQISKTETKFGHMSFLFYCADFTAEAAALSAVSVHNQLHDPAIIIQCHIIGFYTVSSRFDIITAHCAA